MDFKPVFRSLQSRVPFIRPLKFGMYNFGTRLFGWRIEREFKILSRLHGVGLAIDIGGNWGQSILALKRTARPSRIVSFEPDIRLAERLRQRFKNDLTVEVQRFALSDDEGNFKLYTPRYRNFVYDGLASLSYEQASDWLPSRMARFDRRFLSIEEQTVPVRTLDSFEFTPDVVKIDVQGAEHQVVKGAVETFRRADPITIVEAPTKELVDLFASLNMTAYALQGDSLTAKWRASTNVLFLSAKRRRQLKL